jgi:hypothetical protein
MLELEPLDELTGQFLIQHVVASPRLAPKPPVVPQLCMNVSHLSCRHAAFLNRAFALKYDQFGIVDGLI